DELVRYLEADPVHTQDAVQWWLDRQESYPRLSRMAIDYLMVPATSVDVERVFSRGRLLLPYVRNRLSAQSTRASMCLGTWSVHGLVLASDFAAAAQLPDLVDTDITEL
ncbi:uncharacterized protein TRAVEDRAFT_112599, partial [Trametes versicolor FP-101664 SS1]|uniref:uncharacterized protein n=1 Tax=Trametes versicolor (strain FP-101664) TaxID=717944 RepID=UPI00046227F5